MGMAKRLVSMDMLRGWAILLMVVFHVFLNVSDLVTAPILSVGIGKLILIAFIAIFVHWQTFFLMISAVVHWFTMSKMLKNGQSIGKIFLKQLIFGFALYVFGFLREPFLSPWGLTARYFISGGIFQGGTWSWAQWVFIYRAETLSSIGLSVMITAALFAGLSLLTKIKLKEKFQSLIKVFILAGLVAVFVFLAPLVQNWAVTFTGVNLYTGDNYMYANLDFNNGYYNRWLINSIAGLEFPLFPNFAPFLVGCIFGVLLSRENPHKRILKYTTLTGLVLTLGGAAYWLFLDGFIVATSPNYLNVGFHLHPTGYVIFSIGLQMIIISIALRMYEFNHKMLIESRKNMMLKISRWIRRWGVFALTIFVFNIIEIIPRGLLTILTQNSANPINYRGLYQTNLVWTLVMVGIVVLMWEGIIRLICLAKGYPSIEFVFLALFKLGKKPIKNDPLNLQGNLVAVEPILFASRQ